MKYDSFKICATNKRRNKKTLILLILETDLIFQPNQLCPSQENFQSNFSWIPGYVAVQYLEWQLP